MESSAKVLSKPIKTLLGLWGRILPFIEGSRQAIARAADIPAKDWRLIVLLSWAENKKENLLFEDETLKDFPRVKTVCGTAVPRKAVSILRAKGLKFTALAPITEADLTPKQKEAWKQNKAMMVPWPMRLCGAYFFVDRSLMRWEDLP